MLQTKAHKSKPIIYDPLIIPRVKQYLEENVHQTFVDVSVMARQLQERYREYNRRKLGPFRQLVEQAYKTVLHSYGLDSCPSADENEPDQNSDLELMEDNPNSNHLNNMLTGLYSKKLNKVSNQPSNDGELIDISSDESGDERRTNGRTKKQFSTLSKELSITKNKKDTQDYAPSDKCTKHAHDSVGSQTDTMPHKKRKLENQSSDVEKTSAPTGGESNLNLVRGRRYKKEIKVKQAQYTFLDFGGMDKVLKELCELLSHIRKPEMYHEIGLSPPHGFLLHGPPGCGKTMLAQAIAGQLNVGFIEVPATELIAGVSGESEERIREVFEQAANNAPCVLFIDEIDAISSNRINAQRDMERRIVAQLVTSLDRLTRHMHGDQVVVIGATTRPECLDPALRRVGRFDHEISLGIPDRKEREEILIVVCESLALERGFDYRKVAELTPGYVGADLVALATRAASLAVKRKYFNQLEQIRTNKLEKDITIVDLIDENPTENDRRKEKEDDLESADEENQNSNEINGKKVLKETAEKGVQSIEIQTESEDIKDKTEKTEDNSEKRRKSTDQDESEKLEKMDVDSEGINDEVNEEKKNDSVTVEEEVSDSDKIKRRPKKDPSLSELISYLNMNTLPFSESQFTDLYITLDDFKEAIKLIKPSAKREGFITVPDITWDDIGSLKDIREELQLAVLAPVKYPEKMKALGLNAPSGILLCGPPGCGKTLLAKAVANEAGVNFISVKGPELLNMYVGESEKAVRQCFQRAKNSVPCVIFFDEFDSLCPIRSGSFEGGSARVVNQLLTEMDGIEDRTGVFLMAASNRPDIIDPAVLRPGRLDTVLYVGLPEKQDRVEIIEALTKHGTQPMLSDDVNLEELGELTQGFTGADLAGLLRQASLLALKESISNPEIKTEDLKVAKDHLLQALKLTRPSVSKEDKILYEKLRDLYTAPRNEELKDKDKFVVNL